MKYFCTYISQIFFFRKIAKKIKYDMVKTIDLYSKRQKIFILYLFNIETNFY